MHYILNTCSFFPPKSPTLTWWRWRLAYTSKIACQNIHKLKAFTTEVTLLDICFGPVGLIIPFYRWVTWRSEAHHKGLLPDVSDLHLLLERHIRQYFSHQLQGCLLSPLRASQSPIWRFLLGLTQAGTPAIFHATDNYATHCPTLHRSLRWLIAIVVTWYLNL